MFEKYCYIFKKMKVVEQKTSKLSTPDFMYFSKSEATIRVVRVKLNNGERVVGIRYPEILVPEVEKTLKEQQEGEKLTQAVS